MDKILYEAIISITSSLIENVIIYQYFVAVMRKRVVSVWAKAFVIIIGIFLLFSSTQIIESPFVRIAVTAIVLVLYSLLYEGKIAIKLLLIVSYISLAAIAEELATSTVSLLPSSALSYDYVTNFLSILLASIFLILLIEILSTFVFKLQKIFYFESKIYFILTPLFSITLTLMFFFDLHTSEYKIMALILLTGINLCFFVMIKAIAVSFETKSKLATSEIELKYQRNIAKRNVEQFRDVRRKTHDTNKHLILIKGLLENGQNVRAIQQLDEYLEMVNISISKIVTDHIGIDSMLAYCNDLSEKNEIKLIIETDIQNKDFNIDDIDTSILLGNIIDNSVEANLKFPNHEQRFLKLKIVTNHKHFFVQATNPVQEQVNVNKTTKKNRSNHGYGIATIKQITEKYDGIVNIDANETSFSIMVILPYK